MFSGTSGKDELPIYLGIWRSDNHRINAIPARMMVATLVPATANVQSRLVAAWYRAVLSGGRHSPRRATSTENSPADPSGERCALKGTRASVNTSEPRFQPDNRSGEIAGSISATTKSSFAFLPNRPSTRLPSRGWRSDRLA
jgi:hypothetical protein